VRFRGIRAAWHVAPVLALLLGAGCLDGCAQTYAAGGYGTAIPPGQMQAQLPTGFGGSEAYQDHSGPAFPVTAQMPGQMGGSEAYQEHSGPSYPVGAPNTPAAALARRTLYSSADIMPDGLIMPNGGERIVQSANSLPD